MQTPHHICAALFGAALFSSSLVAADEPSSNRVAADESFFVRAGVAWFEPVDSDDFDGEAGALVAFGHNFGPSTVELEAGYVEFSESSGVSTDLEFIPVTIGYRYNFALGRRISLGVGVNTGVAFTELTFGNGLSDDDAVWIASGLARLGFAVTERIGVSAGYRYIYVDDPTFFGGFALDDADVHAVDLSVDFRW